MSFKTKIILTGANGFLGKRLFNKLNKNYNIKKFSFKKFSKLNLINQEKYLNNIFLKFKPDVVIHLGTFFSKKNNLQIQKKTLNINYKNSVTLFKNCINHKISKFIYTGSSYENLIDKKKLYPYLKSKKKFSNYLKKKNSKNTKVIAFYLSNIFGEFDKRNKLVNNLLKNKNSKKKIIFMGRINTKINFIHIDDVVNTIKIAVKKNFGKKKFFYNLSFKKSFLLSEIISIFNKFNKNIIFQVSNLNLSLIWESDISFFYKKMNFYTPKINLLNWLKILLTKKKNLQS